MKPLDGCCAWMTRMMSNIGDKGYAVVPFRDADLRRFYLQARPFRKKESQRLAAGEFRIEWPAGASEQDAGLVPIVVALDLPMLHCPHCGTKLDTIIAGQLAEFDAMADAHRHVLSK